MKGKKKFGDGGMLGAPAGGMDPQKAAMMKALMADPKKVAALKAMMAGQGAGAPAMKRGGKVKPAAKAMDKGKKYKKGGTVRGCGIAKKGTRKAKMS